MIGKTNIKKISNKKIKFIDFIESSGAQYIDTGYYPNNNSRIEFAFMPTAASLTSENTMILQASSGASIPSFGACFAGGGNVATTARFTFGSTYSYYADATGLNNNNKHDIVMDCLNSIVKINNSTSYSITKTTFTCTESMKIFKNNGGCIGRLYYLRIYENDILIKDLKPAKDKENICCLYDTINKIYYYNKGTGSFIGKEPFLEIPNNTKLLLHFENNLEDEIGMHTVTMSKGEAVYTDSKFKRGIQLDGSNYVRIPLSEGNTFGTNDFTIAGWFKFNKANGNCCLFSNSYGSNYNGTQVWRSDGYNGLSFCCDISSSSKNRVNTEVDVEANVWYHIALVRYNGTVKLYLNGKSIGSLSANGTLYQSTSSEWRIGSSNPTDSDIREAFDGQIDEFIMINGTALWTTDFTPPFTNYGGQDYEQLINYTMLYDNGYINDIGWNIGWINGKATDNGNYIHLNTDSGSNLVRAWIVSKASYDLTDYSTAYIKLDVIARNGNYLNDFALTTSSLSGYNSSSPPTESNNKVPKTGMQIHSMDISALAISRYIMYIVDYRNTVNIYGVWLCKKDDWQTLVSLLDIHATSINDVLLNSEILLNSRVAINFMIKQCTGDFMINAIQNETFLTALENSPYNSLIYANEHWAKFLNIAI